MKNFRRIPNYLLALSVLATVSSQVAAAPSYFGYTGLMKTPTADTLKTGGANLGGVFLNGNNDTSFLSANLGVVESLEVGAALVSPERGDDEVIINAKYAFMKETSSHPALAIGMSDVIDQLDATPYVVMSKSFSIDGQDESLAPRFHLGVGGGRLSGVFAGVSATLSDRVQLMVEYDTDDLNFGVQFAAGENLRLHAGLVGGDDLGLGMSYNAGF